MDRDPRELDGAWTRHQRHAFTVPAPDLAPFLAAHWAVEWDYATPYRQKIVPYPQVQVTVRPGREPEVHGVSSRHVVRVLEGRDRVVGAAFRPGVFRAVLGGSVSAITDRVLPASAVAALAGGPDEPVDAGSVQRWLRAALPGAGPGPAAADAEAAVALVAADRDLTRVDRLAAATGVGVRTLQRLFAEHVGVGPKWVIRRYRLHEVTERLAAGDPVDWAGLAADLGFADQAHLSRDFAALFGEPPTTWARRYPGR